MIIRRLGDAFARQDWFVVFIELIVLVLGIFIGLQVDDWNQARKDRLEERVFLEELLEDFDASESSLASSIERLERVATAMIGLLEQSAKDAPDWDMDQLNTAFRQLHNMPTFIAVSRAYDNLTGAGDLRLLRNRELKNALAQYYSFAELIELIQNTHEMELVGTFQPYIIENADFQAVAPVLIDDFPLPPPVENDRLLAVLHSREFRNVMTQKWTIATDLLDQSRQMLERTRAVQDLLKSELGYPTSAAPENASPREP